MEISLIKSDLDSYILTPVEPGIRGFIYEAIENLGDFGNIIKNVHVFLQNLFFLPFYATYSSLALGIYRIIPGSPNIASGGKNTVLAPAIWGAFGETFERLLSILYALRLSQEESPKLQFGSYLDLSKKYSLISPEKMRFFHEKQFLDPNFLYSNFTSETKISWVLGRNLITGEEVYVPAQYALLAPRLRPGEELIAYSTSAGLSASYSWCDSVYRGIIETIERDAAILYWVSKIPPPLLEIDRDLLSDFLDGVDAILNNKDLELRLYYLKSDVELVHVIMAVLIFKKFRYLKMFSGLGADMSLIHAIKTALLEVLQAQTLIGTIRSIYLKYGKHSNFYYVRPNATPKEINNIFQAFFYWGYPENLARLRELFLNSKQTVSLRDLSDVPGAKSSCEKKLNVLMDYLSRKSIDVITVDQTPNEVRGRIYITKVIIPQLVYYYGSKAPFFGNQRLSLAPKIIRNENRLLSFEEYNRLPFPFP